MNANSTRVGERAKIAVYSRDTHDDAYSSEDGGREAA